MANTKDFKVKNGIKPTVYHEAVGTVVSGSVGYSLSSASYDSVSFSVASQDTLPAAFAMKDDGTTLYMHGATNDRLYQYTLSTAWDLSTISYASKSFLTSTQNGNAGPVAFKSDGTSFYVSGSTNDTVYQYDMTTAWDISSASYASKSFSVSGQESAPTGLFFKSDGTKMYMLGSGTDVIYQYTLSTAWDVSTASYDSVTFSLSAQGTAPTSLYFKSDGTQFYTTDSNGVFKYSLSTAWDISTATYSETYDTTGQSNSPYQSWFKPDGTKMYVLGLSNDTIYQYSTALTTNTLDLSTGSVFEITPTSDIQIGLSNPADSGTVSAATLLLDGASITLNPDITTATYDSKTLSIATQSASTLGMFFKPDGTEVYFSDFGSDQIDQYSLSTAWDISTATYTSTVSVASEDATAYGVFLRDDGTKMYMLGRGNGAIYQYSLSTAWDISTATYDSKSLSITGQTTSPITGLWFKSDGTACYVMENNSSSNSIFQYTLSTAWDVSTGSYASKSFLINDGFVAQMWMSTDGTQVYWANYTDDRIEGGDLTTAWDISTASESYNFSFASQFTSDAYGLFISTDYDKMYILDSSADTVHQYSLALTSPTITYDTTLQWGGGTTPTSPAVGETDVLTFSTRDGGTTYQAAAAIQGAK